MYRTLAIAAIAAVLAAPVAFAQQTQSPERLPMPQTIPALPATAGVQVTPRVLVEQQYVWLSNLLRRYGTQASGGIDDTNRVGQQVPIKFNITAGILEIRGIGQIFAPSMLYEFYSPSVYNDTSFIIFAKDDTSGNTDQVYIDQFKNAGAFTVDSVIYSMYRNPNGLTPNFGAKFAVYRCTSAKINLKSASYRTNGVKGLSRSTGLSGFPEYANKPFVKTLSPDALDSTLTPDGQHFVRTTQVFDPPLAADGAAGESMLFMYINDDAPAIDGANVPSDAETQNLIGTVEYRNGEFGSTTGDTLRNPLPGYKTMGTLLFRVAGKDSIYSTWSSGLTYGGLTAYVNTLMTFFGSVNLASGVKYHFGASATQQGLGAVAPNPATTASRVPFTLTATAHVRMELFSTDGRLIKTLVDESFVPGVYSTDLPVNEIPAGAYRVRMIAGASVYSTNVVVNK